MTRISDKPNSRWKKSCQDQTNNQLVVHYPNNSTWITAGRTRHSLRRCLATCPSLTKMTPDSTSTVPWAPTTTSAICPKTSSGCPIYSLRRRTSQCSMSSFLSSNRTAKETYHSMQEMLHNKPKLATTWHQNTICRFKLAQLYSMSQMATARNRFAQSDLS